MTTTLDLPNNYSTNVFTLNDFAEIAYIVCTVATPPTQDAVASSSTPENILARLRKTEQQFREASILAALDVETRQLFTFYKKVDIANAKDQKTLLSKFGYVLRSNTCTIAYKTAARLPDLIKPEQARLYRLFTTAVVSSIKLLPDGDSAVQPVGPNLYLVERTASEGMNSFESISKWSLYRIDLQVIPSGLLVLTIAKDGNLTFLRMLEVTQDSNRLQRLMRDSTAVYLAPVGRIARLAYRGIESRIALAADHPGQVLVGDQTLDVWKQLWKELLPPWLKENMTTATGTEDPGWIEAEIPVQEVDAESRRSPNSPSSPQSSDEKVIWKPISWPASLCFVLDSHCTDPVSPTSSDEDPMQFVQDWLTGTGKQPASTMMAGRSHRDTGEDDDELLFADEDAFEDSEHFQPFAPPAFPGSQSIYPTPPDVLMAHPTPGLSSMDGVSMTPANLARGPSDAVQQYDSEMQDLEDVSGPGGLSGFYDEDLFEELPDDHFGQEGNGDEPNWDFFDRPGGDNKATPMATLARGEIFSARTELPDGAKSAEDRLANDDIRMRWEHQSDSNKVTAPASTTSWPEGNMEKQDSTSNTEKRSFPRQLDLENRSQTSQRSGHPKSRYNVVATHPKGAGPSRRSSMYDGIRPMSTTSDRDNRYMADGDYWFDPNPEAPQSSHPSKFATIFQRPSSSSSGSGSSVGSLYPSSALEASGRKSPDFPRQWTEYQQPPDVVNSLSEVDRKSAEHEIQHLLTLLKPGFLEVPSITDFGSHDGLHTIPEVGSNELMQIAHVLVEQISQTSLNTTEMRLSESPEMPGDLLGVNVDLSGINTSTNASSVQQLVHLKVDSNNSKGQGKIVKLLPSQICVRRADQPLLASASILDFWDTLNLQPESGVKNVTAFCIHPDARNVADGCSNLLHRMADTYSSCALGSHSTGRLPGVTDDGLVIWDQKGPSRSGLHETCQRLGSALATASSTNDTVIVYMISQDKSAAAYLQACQAFYTLFESFRRGLGDRQDFFDIALQVIPPDFIASPETLVIHPQSTYIKLAIEVYNRLPPSDLSGPPAAAGSAIVLAKADSSVHFRLSPTFTSPLFKNGPCLHLAYSISVNGRWITAAWTDELGRVALIMSYCIRLYDPARQRPRQEIFQEMWEVSHDIMGRVHSSWHLAVVKQGHYEPAEVLEWQQIIDGSSTSRTGCLTLLVSVQLEPVLRVFPPHAQSKSGQPSLQNTYGTPASTPQASMTSPDQIVAATPTPGGSSNLNAPTPSDPGFDPNIDGDLTLLDPTEESWGLILPYGVNQSTNMVDLHPALATGLLIKRRGPKIEDGCIAIEVSLIRSSAPATATSTESSNDELLEELIAQYRGLVTLAVTRGCIDPLIECVPWHIAASSRGSRILGEVL
ncbi:hypothetical protein A1O3_01574 [Capronia epimyces CBS 606.96]|uniref:Mediator of RNA polymerase II transcription subunit 13 n=1 Tax=Capronia epimyces CBS 606.96 TaxID=1182542 RepID=W9YKE1_9EURO|nr:uncharacterized protein A1O3_01574 [Capronia epimyces CBS 606.96]EXJ93018.1 hypothetical protein A1O3_01574 [Capronia epimyces CBS 606.96]